LDSLSQCLRLDGFDVRNACDGVEAMAAMAGENFDAIVIDICLPQMCGPEVLARIRAAGINIPAVLTTASSGSETLLNVQSLGMFQLLFKPFYPQQLTSILRTFHRVDNT
jgi:CheY-like chemotaxis protein